MTLLYRGRGRFFPGIPTTDLAEGDIARLGGEDLRRRLLKSGLYVEAKPPKKDAKQ